MVDYTSSPNVICRVGVTFLHIHQQKKTLNLHSITIISSQKKKEINTILYTKKTTNNLSLQHRSHNDCKEASEGVEFSIGVKRCLYLGNALEIYF